MPKVELDSTDFDIYESPYNYMVHKRDRVKRAFQRSRRYNINCLVATDDEYLTVQAPVEISRVLHAGQISTVHFAPVPSDSEEAQQLCKASLKNGIWEPQTGDRDSLSVDGNDIIRGFFTLRADCLPASKSMAEGLLNEFSHFYTHL